MSDNKISNISFEYAVKELEKIVEELESGEMTLEDSIDKFQRGIELSKFCSRRLDEAERKISLLVEDDDGGLSERSFMQDE